MCSQDSRRRECGLSSIDCCARLRKRRVSRWRARSITYDEPARTPYARRQRRAAGVRYNLVAAIPHANVGWLGHAWRSELQLSCIARFRNMHWWRAQQKTEEEPSTRGWRHERQHLPRGVDFTLQSHASRDWSKCIWDRSIREIVSGDFIRDRYRYLPRFRLPSAEHMGLGL